MNGDHYPGREILGAGSSRAVLAKLLEGDPLELGPRCEERVEEAAVFVACDRLRLRAIARVAYAAPRYKGLPKLDVFLAECIDEAIGDLLKEDIEDDRNGVPVNEPWDPRYAFVSEQVGLDPSLARSACIRFNDLPFDVRRTYFVLALGRRTFNRWVAEGNGPPEAIHERLRRAFEALSLPYDENDFRRGGEA